MRSSLAVVALFVACCVTYTVQTRNHRGIVVGEVHPDNQLALEYVRLQYAKAYPGRGIETAPMRMNWVSAFCDFTHSQAGIPYRGKCYWGLTWECTEMYTAMRPRISQSAFTHEVGHCVHMLLGGNGDPAHADFEFWEENRKINQRLRGVGL